MGYFREAITSTQHSCSRARDHTSAAKRLNDKSIFCVSILHDDAYIFGVSHTCKVLAARLLEALTLFLELRGPRPPAVEIKKYRRTRPRCAPVGDDAIEDPMGPI